MSHTLGGYREKPCIVHLIHKADILGGGHQDAFGGIILHNDLRADLFDLFKNFPCQASVE